MLRLVLMRHAKSSWADNNQHDFDRPLNHRGIRNAKEMGLYLKQQGISVQRILCSPAKRTQETLELVQEGLQVLETKLCPNLYEASLGEVLSEIQNQAECPLLMVLGHNPSISYTAAYLANHDIEHFSTGAVLCLDFDFQNWRDIQPHSGTIVFKKFPKEL